MDNTLNIATLHAGLKTPSREVAVTVGTEPYDCRIPVSCKQRFVLVATEPVDALGRQILNLYIIFRTNIVLMLQGEKVEIHQEAIKRSVQEVVITMFIVRVVHTLGKTIR